MDNSQPKILIIEDELEMAQAIRLRLESRNYLVVEANSGLDGLNKARIERPDLIILDVMLPKIDGFTICRVLKYDEDYGNIPIIILTAKTRRADLERGKEMGADAYLTKPFKGEELLQTVERLLAKKAG